MSPRFPGRIKICWADEVDDPPTCAEMLSQLNSWLDRDEFKGSVNVTFVG